MPKGLRPIIHHVTSFLRFSAFLLKTRNRIHHVLMIGKFDCVPNNYTFLYFDSNYCEYRFQNRKSKDKVRGLGLLAPSEIRVAHVQLALFP